MILGAQLRQTDPEIARGRHRRNRIFRIAGRIERREDHPVLPAFKRPVIPIHTAEGQAKPWQIHVNAVGKGRFSAEKIDFHHAAQMCAEQLASVEFEPEPCLPRSHAERFIVAERVRRHHIQRNIGDVVLRRVLERVEEYGSVKTQRKAALRGYRRAG